MSVSLLAVASCSNDGMTVQDGGNVEFGGAVKKTSAPSSKAGDYNENDFDPINNSSSEFGSITLCRSVDGLQDVYSVYEAEDGVAGRLACASGQVPLIWAGTGTAHTFYAWTTPSVGTSGTVTGGVEMDGTVLNRGKVTFGILKDTDLEKFIVAEEGPLSYESNGSYVRLLFYRPVAKIRLDQLVHIDARGSRTHVEKCTVTFPNLPKTAVFDAKKTRVEGGNYGDVWLDSGDAGYEEAEKGVTWDWDSTTGSDADYDLYVQPFVFGTDDGVVDGSQPDETQPGYFIITAVIDGVEKTYYATLAGMVDIKELQAGQFMRMDLSVQDGAGGGIGCEIVDWNTEEESSVSHRRPGLYSQEDADALLDVLTADPVDLDALNRFCREENGVMVIHLYTDVDWSSLTEELVLPEGYAIDSQGYEIVFGEGGAIA